MINISHTNHMSHLFLRQIIWQSMHFDEIAEVMTQHGLETTESQAMDAYDNCMELGYPRGGIPSAWDLGSIGSRKPIWLELLECETTSCDNKVRRAGDLCSDCNYENAKAENPSKEALDSKQYPNKNDGCRCGKRDPHWNCTVCHYPLCASCCPRIPITGTLFLQHYECLTPSRRKRFVEA